MDKENYNFPGKSTFFFWKPAAWLRISGEDSAAFLQGQFSNDLRGWETGRAVYGLWLNHKGRVLADSFVVRAAAPGEFWVGSYFSAAAVILERLEAFIIADDVTVEDFTADWAAVSVWGEATPPEGTEPVEFDGRRGMGASREWVFPVKREDVVRSRLGGGREATACEVERWRIEAGIPAVPADIGPGELPNEGGLDRDAISYTKGCYLGQEVMARLKSMGQVRRRLLSVRGSGAAPVTPAPLFQGERRVGELRSAVDRPGDDAAAFAGLALISLLNLRAGEPLSLAPNGAGDLVVVDQP